LALVADAWRASAGAPPDRLRHGDARAHPGLTALAAGARGTRALEELARARQDIEANLEPEAVLERALAAVAPPLAAGPAAASGAPRNVPAHRDES
jgi:hypothetical protein